MDGEGDGRVHAWIDRSICRSIGGSVGWGGAGVDRSIGSDGCGLRSRPDAASLQRQCKRSPAQTHTHV